MVDGEGEGWRIRNELIQSLGDKGHCTANTEFSQEKSCRKII